MRRVHLDHNATTPMRPEARAALLEALDDLGGNPSSLHAAGRRARAVLDEARERTARALGVHEDEVVFTSGGTEAVNLALRGVLGHPSAEGRGLLTTAIEHACVLETADDLAARGTPVDRLGVDREGRLDLGALRVHLDAGATRLLSLQMGNNEVGTVPDLESIVAALADLGPRRPLLHLDAAQGLGRLPLRLAARGVDLASFSAHKVGGPLGFGVLYRRRGVPLQRLLAGGEQEAGLRPGTENAPAAAAAAVAVELAVAEQEARAIEQRALVRLCWSRLHASFPRIVLNGPPIDAPDRLPNTLNVSFPETDGRTLVARLDLEGLEVSAGSACASGSLEPSHVLLAMGRDREAARSALRLSFGRTSTASDVEEAVEILRRTIAVAR